MEINKSLQKEMTAVVVDLVALAHNYRIIRSHLKKTVGFMAVVKADAYGHGAYEVAQVALKEGASYLVVARFSEAMELRKKGITAPILLLGSILYEDVLEAIKNNITLSVNNFAFAQWIGMAAQSFHLTAKVHIKIDSGMGRLGIVLPEIEEKKEFQKVIEEVIAISTIPNLELEGIYTHYAASDSADKQSAKNQFDKFNHLLQQLKDHSLSIPICHSSNSAALLEMDYTHLNQVRAGIIQYGLSPSDELDESSASLKPVLSWYATIIHLKKVPAGFKVGYGHTFETSRPSVLATVSIGYADGFSRQFSNKGKMLVKGKRVPVVGRVCMDLTIVDVTDVDCQVGDKVVLIGEEGDEKLSANEIAKWINTIGYEVVSTIGKRVPRIYIDEKS